MISGFALGGGPPLPSDGDFIQVIAAFMIAFGVLICLWAWGKMTKTKG